MEPQLRPIAADEVADFARADGYAFLERWKITDAEAWVHTELDRTVAAFVGDEICATGRNYSLELTLPGGTLVPVGGVSWISTRPTHRRQGLLRTVMEYLIRESLERGEVASILTASESRIYRRFGYGPATHVATVEIDRVHAEFPDPPADVTLRIVEPPIARELAPELFDRIRRTRVGAVSRPVAWWESEWSSEEWIDPDRRFDVVAERAGEVVGLVMFASEGSWTGVASDKTIAVRDLLAIDDPVEHALWSFLCDIDGSVAVRAWNRPPDDVVPWLLSDPRRLQTSRNRDWTWLRPLDVAGLLGARTYGTTGALTVAVHDEFLDDPAAIGQFRVEGGPDGAEAARSDGTPDLVMALADLGAISLGGVRPSVLARAGRIQAASVDVLRRAEAMFTTDRLPHAFTWF